ncbi:MAG: hypothetical protein ACO1PW_02590 [Actinomycetota bacterium]
MAKRGLAVLGAIAIVLAAIAVRGAWTDDGPDDGPDTGDGALTVACDPDLAAACRQLEGATVEVLDSAEVSRALVEGELDGVDAWVTSAAWTELTVARATDAEAIGAVERLATAEVAVAALITRAPVLVERCGGAALWRCLGDLAGQRWTTIGGLDAWGDIRIGLPDADTATGLSVLASVATGHFGGPDFAANDFGGFDTWLARLAEPSGSGDRDLLATLVRRRGTYDAGGVLRHQALERPEVEVLDVEPALAVDAVLVSLAGPIRSDLADELRVALVADGWRAAAGDPNPVFGRGVMGALHALWKDVTR